MSTLDHPLRLAVGSHEPGSGKGCAENLRSWMLDPSNITDYPACHAKPLAALIQGLNDTICREQDADLLCPRCSQTVLDIAFSADGTASTDGELHKRFAVWLAGEVVGRGDSHALCAARCAEAVARSVSLDRIEDLCVGVVRYAGSAIYVDLGGWARLDFTRRAIAKWHAAAQQMAVIA